MFDLAIIGLGPAGITAGIYAARKKMNFVVIGKEPGGTASTAAHVENWPGDKTISGMDLMMRMIEHLNSYDADVRFSEITDIKLENNKIHLVLDDDETIQAKSVILATGAKYARLGVKGEARLTGKGVSYCATCDAPLYKGKKVVCIGSSDHAYDGAILLSEFADVTLITLDDINAAPTLVEKVNESDITHLKGKKIVEIQGKEFVEGIKVITEQGDEIELSCDGVFVKIGSVPSIELATKLGAVTDGKFIQVDKKMRTSVSSVFAAGDVTGGLPQIVTAASEGAISATESYKYIKGL